MDPKWPSPLNDEHIAAILEVLFAGGWLQAVRSVRVNPWSDLRIPREPRRYTLATGDFVVGYIKLELSAVVVYVQEVRRGNVHWPDTSIN